jgi:hypothetical protein
MLALYLFCFALGGGFMLVSVLGGDGGDMELDADVDFDLAGEADAGHDTAASRIFSFRTLVYGLFGFGATGAALTALGSGFLPTLLFALAGGALSGALVGTVFRYLGSNESGAVPSDAQLVGLTGRVQLPLSQDRPGSVTIERGARRATFRALPHAGADGDPAAWSAVVVVDVEGGIVRVAPLDDADRDLLPAPGDPSV